MASSSSCSFRCKFYASYISADGNELYCHSHRPVGCTKWDVPQIKRKCQYVCTLVPDSGNNMCSKHTRVRSTPSKRKKTDEQNFDTFDMGDVITKVQCAKCKTEKVTNDDKTKHWICEKCTSE